MREFWWVPAILTAGASPVAAQTITYEGSLTASSGMYFFTERTTSFALNNGFSFRSGRLTLRGTLPVWWQNTTLVTGTGTGQVPTGGPYGHDAVRDSGQARQERKGQGGGKGASRDGQDASRAPSSAPVTRLSRLAASSEPDVPAPEQALTGYQAALADPTVQGALQLFSNSSLTVGVSLTAKIPVADTASIGTGQWDVGASTSITVGLSSRMSLGLDGSYWLLGDLPDFDFRNPMTGSGTLSALLGDRWGLLCSFSAGTSAIEGYDPPMWLNAVVSRFGETATVGLNASIGLTETVPDIGVGLVWSVRLTPRRK